MPKHGFMTPKAIANRIKAKGLSKLRWYCQMCQKQCRDENGFKCHTMSESHARQMQLFSERPEDYMDNFSKEFEDQFIEILRRRGRTRVKANTLYQEHVADRDHVHMNSTKWETLTSFIEYLGKKGVAEVDFTPKGWFIRYIDRNPVLLARQEAIRKREAQTLDAEDRAAKRLKKQVEIANKLAAEAGVSSEKQQATAIERKEGEKLVGEFKMGKTASSTQVTGKRAGALKSVFSASGSSKSKKAKKEPKKLSEMERLMQDDLDRKAKAKAAAAKEKKKQRKDYWLRKHIVVKVMNKEVLKGAAYKQKGNVMKVIDRYVGEVKMIKSGKVLRIDQAELETVIPAIGREVRILQGEHRGESAKLLELDQAKFCVTVRLTSGEEEGTKVRALPLEDVSKISKKEHLA